MHRVVREYALYNNHPRPLADYLVPLVGDKKRVTILDIGSGPYTITGHILDGVEVDIYHCDRKDFTEFWKELEVEPMYPIIEQDMEKLVFPSKMFDIVHCVNALDHTQDAMAAIMEMIRVTKDGGWVYIDCALDQRTSQGKKHYWDAKEDGMFIGKDEAFDLKHLGFEIEHVENHKGERQYDHMIARLHNG